MLTLSILSGLALAAFLAATPVPFQSEIAFVAAIAALPDHVWLVVIVASVANTAGSGVTYALGRGARMFEPLLTRWPRLRPDPAALAKAERWFARWGRWVLLVSWLPGGDLACVLAGALRLRLDLFFLLVGIAKISRYVALALITVGFMG
jgi:membrane protein YqaA with SNARE-associated domain